MLGERIRLARLAARMTLRELADKVGVTAQAISKYETGKDMPRQSVLLRLADATKVNTAYLLHPMTVKLHEVEFRKRANLPAKEQQAVRSLVIDRLEKYLEVEAMFEPERSPGYDLPDAVRSPVRAPDEVEDRADALRKYWTLGDDPIESVVEMLEDHGAKVVMTEADRRFDELAGFANEKYPVVVVKEGEDMPPDRQRFDALHGFGHLALTFGPGIDKERMCHRFAAAVLAPKFAAFRELGRQRTNLDLQHELLILKAKYGMSVAAWIFRAKDLRIITPTTFQKLYRQLGALGWRKKEKNPPEWDHCMPCEKPRRFELLVRQALAEGRIGPAKAADLLGEQPSPRIRRPSDEELRSAAQAAAAESQKDEWDDFVGD